MDPEQETQVVRRAKLQAYRLLAYRNQTSSELRDRLQRRGYTLAIIDAVMHQLVSDGYLDDRKLALDWARYRLQTKPLGRRRLAWELRRRGIASEAVEEVLGEVYAEFDEVTLAEQAARKRLGSGGVPRSPRERQRHVRHLFSLGFDMETIITVLAALGAVDEAQDIMPSEEVC